MITKKIWIDKKMKTNKKIPVNRKEWQSRDHISGTRMCYEIPDLQPGHANPGSSESDLVSGKMKEEVVIYIIVIQARYI